MIQEVKEFFRVVNSFHNAGYFEGESNRRILSELETAVRLGGVIVLSGELGGGKTALVRKLRKKLIDEREFLISFSLAPDKKSFDLKNVFLTLFSDLDTRKACKVSANLKLTEDCFTDLLRSKNKPAVLFIDEAQDCAPKLFSDLERLTESAWKENVVFSVVLVGRPELEKIEGRVKFFRLEGIKGEEKDYLRWVLSDCSKEGTEAEDIFTGEAMNLIARRCHTPLRINYFSWLALEEACRIEQKPVGEGTVEKILNKFEKLESRNL